MKSAEEIVRALAAFDPQDDQHCVLCLNYIDESGKHTDDCPYRMAVDWVKENPAPGMSARVMIDHATEDAQTKLEVIAHDQGDRIALEEFARRYADRVFAIRERVTNGQIILVPVRPLTDRP